MIFSLQRETNVLLLINNNKQKFVTVVVHMNQPVVIFDGLCTLCNYTVDVLLQHDKTGTLLFGSFQDEAPRRMLETFGIVREPTTVYLIEGDSLYTESDAIIRLASYVGLPYSLVWLSVIFPRPIRDAAYRFAARNRYKVFGKREACRVPTEAERKRFI